MPDKIAVLTSGGLDSMVLCAELAGDYPAVYPLFIRHGMHWEETEIGYLRRFLGALPDSGIQSPVILDMPVGDIYDKHWSVSGIAVPDETTPDEEVYLPGRNIMLLTKAGIWCERNGVHKVALAPLKGNPFSDNTPEFYASMTHTLSLALCYDIEIIRPYEHLTKVEVIRNGANLPLHLTYSCIDPHDDHHCGSCNKCRERREAFVDAGVKDDTVYFEYTGS